MIEKTKKTMGYLYFDRAEMVKLDDDEEQLTRNTPNSSSYSDATPAASESSSFVGTCVVVLALAIPLAISRLSWTAMKTTDTALIGHTGTVYLSASAVADLYTQSTGVFINGGVLSTLVSQAYGSSNKKMGGIWLQVSLVVLGGISMPVILSYLLCGPALMAMGVKEELIRPAAYYAFVLAIAVPPRIGIGQISQYLMAQGIANPLVQTGLFSMIVNLILGLVMVFGIGVPGFAGYGFWACPVVTVVVEWLTLFIYIYWYCYKQRLHEKGGCWPEDSFQWVHITSKRVWEYSALYIPAAISSASDWWRVSAIGVVAVSFHDDASLAVFNSAYRITWMSLIVIGSIGSAMGVLLGQELGKGDHRRAKYVTHTCLLLALGLVLVLGAVFFCVPGKVALIFSGDEAVIELYRDVALPLTTMLIAMNLSVLLERVPLSCGRSKMVFVHNLVIDLSNIAL
jgi:multidrug resistance protein, MATE family